MLEHELSEMDRISQLQDGIEEVKTLSTRCPHPPSKYYYCQVFDIMSASIKYLSDHSSAVQVSPDIPITKIDPRAVPLEEFDR
jgi:hypothetical protein